MPHDDMPLIPPTVLIGTLNFTQWSLFMSSSSKLTDHKTRPQDEMSINCHLYAILDLISVKIYSLVLIIHMATPFFLNFLVASSCFILWYRYRYIICIVWCSCLPEIQRVTLMEQELFSLPEQQGLPVCSGVLAAQSLVVIRRQKKISVILYYGAVVSVLFLWSVYAHKKKKEIWINVKT